MSRARSADCRCERSFTCGHCLRNAPPYFFTLDSGERVYGMPAVQGTAQPKQVPALDQLPRIANES
jgi:hypothetical protein